MTPMEIESWRQFYVVHPFDDYHRHYRPAALIASSHPEVRDRGDAITKGLAWLHPEQTTGDYSDADVRTMKALGIKPPRD